jgi:hypothetical protein
LDKWKKKVGDKEAKRIAGTAASRGTSMHTMFENLINNDPAPTKGCVNLSALGLFNSLKPILEKKTWITLLGLTLSNILIATLWH